MTKLRILAPLVLCCVLNGCSQLPAGRHSELRFLISPKPTSAAVTLTCQRSSSGKCYFLTVGNASPTQATIPPGSTITISQVDASTQYCSGIHQLSADTCHPSSLPLHSATIEIRTSSNSNPN